MSPEARFAWALFSLPLYVVFTQVQLSLRERDQYEAQEAGEHVHPRGDGSWCNRSRGLLHAALGLAKWVCLVAAVVVMACVWLAGYR